MITEWLMSELLISDRKVTFTLNCLDYARSALALQYREGNSTEVVDFFPPNQEENVILSI